jgi:hypothetical protein
MEEDVTKWGGGNSPSKYNSCLVGEKESRNRGLNCDDQRHLKIGKWEDYLEEESETEDVMAEAATTMSLISWNY